MRNWYAEAIGIVTDSETNFKALLVEVAKRHPKAVVDARAACANVGQSGNWWEARAKAMYNAGDKVAAIKYVREVTHLGLKEAKDAVEKLCE